MGELRQDQKIKTAIVTALALSFATTVQAQTYTLTELDRGLVVNQEKFLI